MYIQHTHTHTHLDKMVHGFRHRDKGKAQQVEKREGSKGRGGVQGLVLHLDPEEEGGEGDLFWVGKGVPLGLMYVCGMVDSTGKRVKQSRLIYTHDDDIIYVPGSGSPGG